MGNVSNREKREFSNIFKIMEKFLQLQLKKPKTKPPEPEGSRLSRLIEEIKDKEVKVHVVLSIKKIDFFQQTIFSHLMYSFDTSTRLMFFLK